MSEALRLGSTGSLALTGLELAPSQVLGAIRIVPLLRPEPSEDLRIALQSYAPSYAVVRVEPRRSYVSLIPHGLVLAFTGDGAPVAAYGSQLARSAPGPKSIRGVPVFHRMAKQVAPGRLRLLPLHLAMEGFLALHFGGPEIAWSEYSREALRTGLSPRVETSISGRAVLGLEDALRVFEIHEQQSGCLLFVADALAAAFVVPHPEDYRALHRSLIEDFYGELMLYYALLPGGVQTTGPRIDETKVADLDGLARAVEGMRAEWAEWFGVLSGALIDRPLEHRRLQRMGPFELGRFLTPLAPGEEAHLGESVVRRDGRLEYLKTYRLSDRQVRRAWLLEQLSRHDWSLERTAAALRSDPKELVRRLSNAGLGYLLKPHVLAAR